MAILYGILIAFMMVASAFGGFILCMKVRKQGVRYIHQPLGDNGEAQEIRDRAGFETFNLEDPPASASAAAKRFVPRSHSEELKRGSRPG